MRDITADAILMEYLRERSVKCVTCHDPMLGVFSHNTRYRCTDCGGGHVESPMEILKRLQIIGN